jgi:AhpD family alkylhydroperoxidase
MQKTGKKLFSVYELFQIMTMAFRSIPLLKRAKTAGRMDKAFLERIMLAVTEVNGCAMCSYYHTKVALEEGFSAEEIRAMLGGSFANVPKEQLGGVLFAQHYADMRGKPSQESWTRIVAEYGDVGAGGILAVTRMIMMGNAIGIPSGSFLLRFRGKADPRSNVLYELVMMLAMLVFLPLAGLTALVGNLFRVKILPE